MALLLPTACPHPNPPPRCAQGRGFAASPRLRGKVAMVENLGELIIGYVDIGVSDPLIVKLPGSSLVRPGDDIALSADPARLHVFDAAGLTITNKLHVNGGP